MKKTKSKASHTASTKKGSGDFYGSGVLQKVGKIRSNTVGYNPVSKKSLRTPPKSVA